MKDPSNLRNGGIEMTIYGENLDDAMDRLHMDGVDVDPPEELEPVVGFISKVYEGVCEADKYGGKTKSKIADYAGVDNSYVGNALRVLEREGLVKKTDKSWKLPDD